MSFELTPANVSTSSHHKFSTKLTIFVARKFRCQRRRFCGSVWGDLATTITLILCFPAVESRVSIIWLKCTGLRNKTLFKYICSKKNSLIKPLGLNTRSIIRFWDQCPKPQVHLGMHWEVPCRRMEMLFLWKGKPSSCHVQGGAAEPCRTQWRLFVYTSRREGNIFVLSELC